MSPPEIIKPANTLKKAKIGSGPGKLDPNLLKKAEHAMAKLEKDYGTWAREDLTALENCLTELRAEGVDAAAVLRRMFNIALDMKGQGGSFGYIMITAVADSLVKFLDERTEANAFDLEVIAAHLGAMKAIFSDQIRDDGGEAGQQLMDGLFKLKVKAAG